MADRAQQAGFTLIELMVVVAIVAILSLGVGLGTGGVFSRVQGTPRGVAADLAAAVAEARGTAILGRAVVGIWPRTDGWQIMARDVAEGWQAAGRPHVAPGVVFSWTIDGRAFLPRLAAPGGEAVPPVVFLPDGRGVGFGVTLANRTARVRCHSDGTGTGGLTCR